MDAQLIADIIFAHKNCSNSKWLTKWLPNRVLILNPVLVQWIWVISWENRSNCDKSNTFGTELHQRILIHIGWGATL